MMEEIQKGFKISSTNVFDNEGNIIPFNKKPVAAETKNYPQSMNSTAQLL